MTAAYVRLAQLEREAAQLWAVTRLVQQKIDALKARPDSPEVAQVCSDSIMRARHEALEAASALDRVLGGCEVAR